MVKIPYSNVELYQVITITKGMVKKMGSSGTFQDQHHREQTSIPISWKRWLSQASHFLLQNMRSFIKVCLI